MCPFDASAGSLKTPHQGALDTHHLLDIPLAILPIPVNTATLTELGLRSLHQACIETLYRVFLHETYEPFYYIISLLRVR